MRTVIVSLSCIIMVCLPQLCLAQDTKVERSLVDKCDEHIRQRAKLTVEVISVLTNEVKALEDLDMMPMPRHKDDPKGWRERMAVRFEHASRVDRLADFLGEVRAVEAIPVLVEHLDTIGIYETDIGDSNRRWKKAPCALAVLRIGESGAEQRVLLEAISSLPPDAVARLRIAAFVLHEIYGDAGAYALLLERSQSSVTCAKLLEVILEFNPQLKAKASGPQNSGQ